MSGSLALAALQSVLITGTSRAIGTIIPDCAVSEHHIDRLTITSHPTESGANISDHAYKMPSEVTLNWAWSNSGLNSVSSLLLSTTGIVGGALAAAASLIKPPDHIKDIYNQLSELQGNTSETFTLYTGKRTYSDMLIASLSVTTDEHNENVLNVHAVCQQIIRVSTQAVSAPITATQGDAVSILSGTGPGGQTSGGDTGTHTVETPKSGAPTVPDKGLFETFGNSAGITSIPGDGIDKTTLSTGPLLTN